MNIKINRFLGVFSLLLIFFSVLSTPVFATKPSQQIIVGANLKEYKQPTRPNCNINVPSQYLTIQAGIDAASTGDTVCVGVGTYNEDILVNKSIRISGKGVSKSIINGQNPNVDTVDITADNVTLEGFLINGFSTNVAVVIEGSDRGSLSDAIVQYNRVVTGNGGIALLTILVQNNIMQNNIFEGNNSPYVAREGGLDNVGSTNIIFLNNTFIGTVNPNDRQDTGITLDAGVSNGLIKRNSFNTTGTMIELININGTSIINENNFNSDTTRTLGGTLTDPPLNAENNWWGDTDPSDNVTGLVDYIPFALTPFAEY